MIDTSMILSLSIPEVVEIKRRIIQDRKYNVPSFFYSYIDDDFIIDTITLDDRSDERDAFIREYQKNKGFHSYKNLIVTLLESNLLEDLHLFDPILITKYCKRSLNIFTLDDIIQIMYGWYIHEKEIPYSIVYLYILKSCGKMWFLSTTTSLHILKGKLSEIKESDEYGCMLVEILYQLYSNVPKLNREFDCSIVKDDSLGYNSILEYYEMDGSKFVHIMKQHIFVNDVYSTAYYLKLSNNIERLPYELVKSNSKILDRLSIPMYEKAVTESLLKNANNLHMITWGNKLTADNFMYITELILKSDIPLRNFRDYVRLYKTVKENHKLPISLNRELTTRFIVSGTDVNTMLNHIDMRECWYEVFRYGSDDSIRELIRNAEECQWTISNQTIGQFVINELAWMMHPQTYDKILRLVCEDSSIFEQLDTPIKNSILKSTKIDWLLSEFPNLLSCNYVKTFVCNSTVDIRKLCRSIPQMLSYLSSEFISPSTIQYVAKTRGYIELPCVRLTVENVMHMIDDDCGYGYILDLPTFVQMNVAVVNILNRIFKD